MLFKTKMRACSSFLAFENQGDLPLTLVGEGLINGTMRDRLAFSAEISADMQAIVLAALFTQMACHLCRTVLSIKQEA